MPTEERRSVERTPLPTAWRATFEHEGQEREAMMVDCSKMGAGFLVYQAEPFGLSVGDQIVVRVTTPLGESTCTARVVWLESVTAGLRFGVKFEQIAVDDPLIIYADSPF
jgi:hypothetical protein